MSSCYSQSSAYSAIMGINNNQMIIQLVFSSFFFVCNLAILIFVLSIGYGLTTKKNKIAEQQNRQAIPQASGALLIQKNQQSQANQEVNNQTFGEIQNKKPQIEVNQVNNNRQNLGQIQNPKSSKELSFKQKAANTLNNIPNSIVQGVKPSSLKLIGCCIVFIIVLVIMFVFLLLTLLSLYQAIVYVFSDSQCLLKNSLDEFVNGGTQWVGTDNLVSNTTQLTLALNTRPSVSESALKGLLLNGTVATVKPGIGFSNNTIIQIVNSQSNNALNTLVTTNSVQSYISAATTQWLYRNSSLSGTHKFPLCQTTSVPIQHPIDDSGTVQLGYMDSVCTQLTSQVNQIIANGKAADDLLSAMSTITANPSPLRSNLSTYSSTYSNLQTQGSELQQSYSSTNNQVYTVTILVFLTVSVVTLGILIPIITIYFCYYGCYEYFRRKFQIVPQARPQTQGCCSNLISKTLFCWMSISHMFLIIGMMVTSIFSYNYQNECSAIKPTLTDSTAFAQSSLSGISPLMSSFQACTSSSQTYFLRDDSSTQLANQVATLSQLKNLSTLYNATTPVTLLNSNSVTQVQVLKGYLTDMKTMPLKSSTITVQDAITQLQLYSSGAVANSQQIKNCPSQITDDHFVFNANDCQYQLLNVSNTSQWTTTQSRCIIIPTFDGSAGSVNVSLNQVQHNVVLTGACNTIDKMFDIAQASCFMGTRLAMFNVDASCTAIGTQYGRRVKNLLTFAMETASYTDTYLQNIRNYQGVYFVMSTNLTQFFNGANMSAIVQDFSLASNLVDNTKCTYIKTKIQAVYNSYCPQSGGAIQLFSQAIVWSLLGQFFLIGLMVVIYVMDVSLRFSTFDMDKYQARIQNRRNQNLEITEAQLMNQQNRQVNIELQVPQNNNIFQYVRQRRSYDHKPEKSSTISPSNSGTYNEDRIKQIEQYQTYKKYEKIPKYKPHIYQQENLQDIKDLQFRKVNPNQMVNIQRTLPPVFFNFQASENSDSVSQGQTIKIKKKSENSSNEGDFPIIKNSSHKKQRSAYPMTIKKHGQANQDEIDTIYLASKKKNSDQ